jgi:hypothetical protein
MRNPNLIVFPSPLSSTDITGIRSSDANDYINKFNSIIREQKKFRVSKCSWEKLKAGKDKSGVSWLMPFEKVVGFVFCIYFKEEQGSYTATFRIRTITERPKFYNFKILNWRFSIPNLLRQKVNFVEQNYIAHPKDDGSDLLFIDDSDPYFNRINNLVQNYKNDPERYFGIGNTPGTEKNPTFNTKQKSAQQGVIFKSNTVFMDQLDSLNKQDFTISFGWDSKLPNFNYIISINPDGLINGIKCPIPYEGCNYNTSNQ